MLNNKSSIINTDKVHFEALYPKETRFSEIEKIITFIKEGKSCQVIGLPGVGRSNLFGLLSFNRFVRGEHLGENQKWFHFIYANFSEVKGRSLLDVNKFFFLSLVTSLRERKMDKEHKKVQEIFKEHIKLNDELVLFQGLKEAVDYLAIDKELTIVFLIDRFEEYIHDVGNEFFANLRILRNRAKYRFSAIFSLNRPLDLLLDPTVFAQFYEFVAGNIVYLSISDPVGLAFRISYIEKVMGKKLDKEIIDEVLKLTGGHGKLTRVSLENITTEQNQNNLSDFLMKNKNIQATFLEIWQELTPSEQKSITNDAVGEEYLEKTGLIINNKITIPLLKEYASKKPSTEKEKFKFNESANQITKAESIISENLTLLEFKLLKFFIQNAGKILERDEIVENVWQSLASTEGVTDQALDQLVSRVRKKIEENPKDPQVILTIKGRGFKFEN
ncbi:helix-turn-helix domain-containing protein [Patescibacteria group bacterium]|nr:helix-turn-helix domain-containing protein [Patescibacteria group bacterium]